MSSAVSPNSDGYILTLTPARSEQFLRAVRNRPLRQPECPYVLQAVGPAFAVLAERVVKPAK